MSPNEFLLIYASVLVTMLACRCIPMFALRGRTLPQRVEQALELIPASAFSALVANDLVNLTLFADSPAEGIMVLAAAAIVVFVSRRTGSLIWSALVGLVSYWFLVLAL